MKSRHWRSRIAARYLVRPRVMGMSYPLPRTSVTSPLECRDNPITLSPDPIVALRARRLRSLLKNTYIRRISTQPQLEHPLSLSIATYDPKQAWLLFITFKLTLGIGILAPPQYSVPSGGDTCCVGSRRQPWAIQTISRLYLTDFASSSLCMASDNPIESFPPRM